MTHRAIHSIDPLNAGTVAVREVVHQSATSLIVRLRLLGGTSVIQKEPRGPNAVQRLDRESKILARLEGVAGVPRLAPRPHPPNVLAIEDDGCMPLGAPLRREPLDISALLSLALNLAQTLAAIHRRGVLHLNISPQHVLLCGADRRVLLIDFQLASTFSQGQPEPSRRREIPGALLYLAPEQTGRTGRGVDQRADLYALGATLYELATGRPPFSADDPLQLIHDHLARLPEPPAALQPKLPVMLSEIILHLLEKEPDRRYQSAEGLACDLARLHERQAQGDDTPFPLGDRDFPLRLAPPSRLVGREGEIATIRQALDEATRGQRRLLLVAGAPGVGKTSLINKLRPMVTALRGWFIAGKFDQYRHDAPTATVQALRALGRLLLAAPQVQLAEKRERILAHVGANAGLLAAMLPEFATVLGVKQEVASGDPVMVEARLRFAVIEMLRAIVSPARPLVMVLDDLQWAGPAPIRFIDTVLADDPPHGLLLVGVYRQEELGPTNPISAVLPRWRQEGVDPLVLKSLPPAGLRELLGEMLRLPPAQSTALARVIGTRTGGNPFDTVELVNALRRDGALVPGANGWEWDATEIRRYVGRGDVVDLLGARIAQLPAAGRELLETVACLGGEVRLGLLRAATGLTSASLEAQLAAPVEDGLLVQEQVEDITLHLRHDRVQQVAYGAMPAGRRSALHLALARRLARRRPWRVAAALQYLACIDEVQDPRECRRAAHLLHEVTAQVRRTANHGTMEHLLAAAAALLARAAPATAADDQLLAALEIERHSVLYSLGRLEEADAVYGAIEARRGDELALMDAACVQVASLTNRGRRREAVELGLSLLRQLGLDVPELSTASQLQLRMDALNQWVAQYDLAADQARPEASDPRVVATARLINRLQAPAFFCDMKIVAWLVLESQRLWAAHGPCAALVANLSRATLVSTSLAQDYRTGYDTVRHVLSLSEARGYEPETSQARHLFAISTGHWFEPLEGCIRQAQRAREGLVLGGDLQNACFTYRTSIPGLLECAPTLDSYAAEIESGMVFAARTGNHQAVAVNLADRQLLRTLRGQTYTPGGFDDTDFNEQTHLAGLTNHPMAAVTFHIRRALAAALFADPPTLQQHAAAAMPLLSFIQAFYPTALAYLLQALALAERVRSAPAEQRVTALAEMDACREWLAARAADAPANFLHLLKWVEAERAWAVGDFRDGIGHFDAALREAGARRRPWHQALITERAGLFHLAHGLACTGEMLLAQARRLYQAWGAGAKVKQMEQLHGFLLAPDTAQAPATDRSGSLSADAIDTLAVLRASQALSSETSLARLKARVVDLLGTLTGATAVQFVLWSEDEHDWLLTAAQDDAPVPIEEAGRRGLLPLSAFRYVERTREPLLVEDATRDDRFARDPYVASRRCCSLLIVPILSQGAMRAVLLLENHLSRGAFLADRLEAVMLIAGQLTVSLDNALLYEHLEQRVREQTQALRQTQADLVTAARQAGMAEIATNVLHNVGNILNSVNVSADVVSGTLRNTRAQGLSRAVQLMTEHSADLGEFLTRDARGKLLPGYLDELAQTLAQERQRMADELDRLTRSIDHIKDVVATQQSYAVRSSMVEPIQICDLVEDALRLNGDALARSQIAVVREFAPVPMVPLDRARVLQILVNLIANACKALLGVTGRPRIMTLQVDATGGSLRVRVKDEGEGILPENLTRIFSHGFTTRKDGHGFGLHSCALAAREMGGTLSAQSDGYDKGAAFTLQLPIDAAYAEP